MTTIEVFHGERYDAKKEKQEIAQAQMRLLKFVESSEKSKMSWWRTCVDLSPLQFRKGAHDEDEIVLPLRIGLLQQCFYIFPYIAAI